MTIEHLAYLLMALQAVDAITTYLAIGKGASEGNPIMRKLFEKIGMVPALLVIKGAMAAAAWHWRYEMGMVGLGLLCAWYIAVAVNNLLVMRRQVTSKQRAG